MKSRKEILEDYHSEYPDEVFSAEYLAYVKRFHKIEIRPKTKQDNRAMYLALKKELPNVDEIIKSKGGKVDTFKRENNL